MIDIVMPRLSDSMEEGTIVRWLKADGDIVTAGDELVEIETDKATMVYEADSSGVLRIAAPEGSTLRIGEVIALVGAAPKSSAGSDTAPAAEQRSEEAAPEADLQSPNARTLTGPDDHERSGPGSANSGQSLPDPGGGAPTAAPGLFRATPVARRTAREHGLEIGGLHGTGPQGRVTKRDVLAAIDASGARGTAGAPIDEPLVGTGDRAGATTTYAADHLQTEPLMIDLTKPKTPRAPSAGDAKGAVEVRHLTRTQQVVARRMAESKATAPDFAMTVSVEMDACQALREQIKSVADGASRAPSINDMIVKACAIALQEHPRVNGAYRDGRWELYERINVGVAVAGPDALIVPTVFDADRKSLGQIARETASLAAAVREGKITPSALSGGTFTVSNLGMYGIARFTAVINPPQAAILAVGAVESRPVVRDEAIVIRRMMDATLIGDHRILNGVDAARFVGRVRELLQSPLAVLL